MKSDEQLMAGLARGEEAACRQLVDRHHAWLLGVFRHLGLDEHAAEDCAQNALLRAFELAPRYVPSAPLRGLLLHLARNVLVDWRRRRRDAGLVLHPPDSPLLASEIDGALPVGERLDVRAAVARLPERQRVVVELAAWDGLRQREIARLLGIPVGTVKSRTHVALKSLRTLLGGGSGRGTA